ncbi:hypothetical protein [Nodularia sp. UHCC 0506]
MGCLYSQNPQKAQVCTKCGEQLLLQDRY